MVAPSSNAMMLEISMGKFQSVETCKDAGADWLREHPDYGANLVCRLNCYEANNHRTVCERAEPIRRQG